MTRLTYFCPSCNCNFTITHEYSYHLSGIIDKESCPCCYSEATLIRYGEERKEEDKGPKLSFSMKKKKGTFIGIFKDWNKDTENVCILLSGKKYNGELLDLPYSDLRLYSYELGDIVHEVSPKDKKQRKAWRKLKALISKSINALNPSIVRNACKSPEYLGKPIITFYHRQTGQ